MNILGLFVDETNKTFRTTLENAVANRDARNEKMAKRFRELGIPLTLEELRTQSPDTVITRAHFARYLIEHHYVKTNDEAFDRYLGYHAPCFIPITRTKCLVPFFVFTFATTVFPLFSVSAIFPIVSSRFSDIY